MHWGVSALSGCDFIHSGAFEEVSGHRVLWNVAPLMRLCLEVLRETGLILRCNGKVGNPFQTKQGNRPSCRGQEGRRGSEQVLSGTPVFLSSQPGMSGNFLGCIKDVKYCLNFKSERGTSL